MKFIRGGICAPQGFLASGINCGIKKKKKDLALIYSRVPATACGLFTANTFKAQSVRVSKKHLADSKAQAIIVNSGNANCFTGAYGLLSTRRMAEKTAKRLSINKKNVLVSSTGIIGRPLPIEQIERNLPRLVKSLSKKGNASASEAILTTDKVIKETALRIKMGSTFVNIGVMAKGAGMISPKMSTMLCFITTDALITPQALKYALKVAVDSSFNNITVDGCMSTNDAVFILANGLSGNPCISLSHRLPSIRRSLPSVSRRLSSIRDKNFNNFLKGLNLVCLKMAQSIVRDAEGATKFIEINIDGASSNIVAREIGLSVANSNLFKTAVYGKSPNWGRIIAAVGSLGLKIKEEDIKIKFSSFKKRDVKIDIILDQGKGRSQIYTSDLTPEYVKINAGYN